MSKITAEKRNLYLSAYIRAIENWLDNQTGKTEIFKSCKEVLR
jgi:hypothetical protein